MKKSYLLLLVLFFVVACSSKKYDTIDTEEEANAVAAEQTKKEYLLDTKSKTEKISDRVFFDFNKDNLTEEATSVLDATADWLSRNPEVKLLVEGHTDERGTKEYNIGLGQRRASSVRKYLESKGIDAARIKIISYGKERPEFAGSNEEAWSRNRRAVSVILETK